jgi:hypothetical protein
MSDEANDAAPEPDPLPSRREQLLDLLSWSRTEGSTALHGALLVAASAWNVQVAAHHPGRTGLHIHA